MSLGSHTGCQASQSISVDLFGEPHTQQWLAMTLSLPAGQARSPTPTRRGRSLCFRCGLRPVFFFADVPNAQACLTLQQPRVAGSMSAQPVWPWAYCSLSSVIGRSRTRLPVALKTALAMAAATPVMPISPMPRAPSGDLGSGMPVHMTSISGTSRCEGT